MLHETTVKRNHESTLKLLAFFGRISWMYFRGWKDSLPILNLSCAHFLALADASAGDAVK